MTSIVFSCADGVTACSRLDMGPLLVSLLEKPALMTFATSERTPIPAVEAPYYSPSLVQRNITRVMRVAQRLVEELPHLRGSSSTLRLFVASVKDCIIRRTRCTVMLT